MVSLPHNSNYARKISQYEIIEGARFNTGEEVSQPYETVLQRLKSEMYPKSLWVDLKGRELRVVKETEIPKGYVEINHRIEVDTPVKIWFNEGTYGLNVVEVIDGYKLKLDAPEGLKIKFKKGMPINMPSPSLRIHEYLTEKDKAYLKAEKKVGIHRVIASYVERGRDILDILDEDPDAEIIAKIESKKGLDFITNEYNKYKTNVTLMAARGDLYPELDQPHQILNATRKIIETDPNAIAASRILPSLKNLDNPITCQEICDVGYLIELGYKRFLLGDEISMDEETVSHAVGLLGLIFKDYCSSSKRPNLLERLIRRWQE
jgi:pyruvate kinase